MSDVAPRVPRTSPPPFESARARLLPEAFFERPAEVVAPELLGKVLVAGAREKLTAGLIVETEAYLGAEDPGSHAATKGVTARNRVMYGPPGRAYVYFTYGSHHMLNLVTCAEGTAGAVLVRAVEPLAGVATMVARRGGRTGVEVTNGPGKLAQAFGIHLGHNGSVLSRDLGVYDAPSPRPGEAGVSGRIGLTAGHELQLRFFLLGNRYVSRGRPGRTPRKKLLTSEREN